MNIAQKILLVLLIIIYPFHYKVTFLLILLIFCLLFLEKLYIKFSIYINGKDALFAIICFIDLSHVLFQTELVFPLIKILLFPWILSVIFQNYRFKNNDISHFIYIIGITSVILSLLIFSHKGGGKFDFSIEHILNRSRQGSIFLDVGSPIGPTQLSTLAAISFLSLIYCIRFFGGKAFIINVLLVLIALLVIVLTSSRTTWMALACSLLFTLSYNYRTFIKNLNIAKTVFCLLLIISVFYTTISIVPHDKYSEIYSRFSAYSSIYGDSSFNARLYRWSIATDLISEKPLLGWGLGYFNLIYGSQLQTTHNEFLAHAIGVGLLGAFLWFLIYLFILKRILWLLKHYDSKLGIYFVNLFIFVVITGLTEHISLGMYKFLNPLIWLQFGIVLGVYNQNVNVRRYRTNKSVNLTGNL